MAANWATGATSPDSSCGWTSGEHESKLASFSCSAAISSTSPRDAGTAITRAGAEHEDAVGTGAVVDRAGALLQRRPRAAREDDAARRGRQRVVHQRAGIATRAVDLGAGGGQEGQGSLVLDLDARPLEELEGRLVDGGAALAVESARVQPVCGIAVLPSRIAAAAQGSRHSATFHQEWTEVKY